MTSENGTFTSGSSMVDTQIVSENTFNIVMTVTDVVLVPLITIFGTAGNFITMLVLFNMGFKDTTNVLLFSLAICDFIFLLLGIVRKVELILFHIDPYMARDYNAYTQVYIFQINRYFMVMSAWHISLIAIERLIAVLFPFKVSIWVTRKRIIICHIAVYIVYFFIFLPLTAFRYELKWRFDKERNQTVPVVGSTEIQRKYYEPMLLYSIVFVAGFVELFRMAIIVACTAIVVVVLVRKNKERTELSSSKRAAQRIKELKVSRMLITVCIVYIVSISPTISFILSSLTFVDDRAFSRFFKMMQPVTEVFYVVNSSVNFIIYICMASKFQDTLKKLLRL